MFKYLYKNKKLNPKHVLLYMLCFAIFLVNTFSAIGVLFSKVSAVEKSVDENNLWSSHTQVATKDTDSYYVINSPEKFAWLFYKSSSSVQKAKITCDLDMSKYYWLPSTIQKKFELDGKEHIVSGLRFVGLVVIDGSDYYSNIGIVGISVNNNIQFSNLCLNSIVISNILLDSDHNVVTSEISCNYFGAFVAQKVSGKLSITNCKAYGNLSFDVSNNKYYAGVFAGNVANIDLTNCFNYVQIIHTGAKESIIGGLVGVANNSCNLNSCGNYGNITTVAQYLGGLAGKTTGLNLNNAKCFNSGDITNNSTGNTSCTGGLVGYSLNAEDGNISCVYNTGKISLKTKTIGSVHAIREDKRNAGAIIGYSNCDLYFSNLYTTGKFLAKQENISIPNLTAKELCPQEYWVNNKQYEYDFYFSNGFSYKSGYNKWDSQFIELNIQKSTVSPNRGSNFLGNTAKAIIDVKNSFYYDSQMDTLKNSTDGFTVETIIKYIDNGRNSVATQTSEYFSDSKWKNKEGLSFNEIYIKREYGSDFYWHPITNYCSGIDQYWLDTTKVWSSWPYDEIFDNTYEYLGREYQMIKHIHESLGGDAVTSKYEGKGFEKTFIYEGFNFRKSYLLSPLVQYIYDATLCGVCVKKINDITFEIIPLIEFEYSGGWDIYNMRGKGSVYIPVEQVGKYTLNLDNLSNYVSNKNELVFNSSTGFTRSDSINGGLPVFKEMYWGLS